MSDGVRETVEQAWLAAGKRGDVQEMRRLRASHPQWLDLQRVVAVPMKGAQGGTGASPRSPMTFCDWEQFYLATIGASALHAAAWEGHAAILQYLLEAGQSPDARDDRGMTVLVVTLLRHSVQAMRAVFMGQAIVQLNTVVDCREEDAQRLTRTMAVCDLLVRHGANVDTATEDGKAALHFAANDELYAVAQLLLDAGACVDPTDEDGQTPLHYAVESQSLRATSLLVSRGARVDLVDRRGASPVAMVVAKRDVNALRIMLDHYRHVPVAPGAQSFAGYALLLAAEAGTLELVDLVLRGRYAVAGERNARGETAMHLAIVKHHEDLVRLLVEVAIVVDGVGGQQSLLLTTTAQGESPVHYAARYGSPDVMRFLLEAAGPGVNAAINQVTMLGPGIGHTPLFLATTATAGSPTERTAKVALLRQRGARLLGDAHHVFMGFAAPVSSRSGIFFSWGVRRCVGEWLAECGGAAITPFCLNYAGRLATSRSSPVRGGIAQAMVQCGFAVDVLPLLRECRVETAAVVPLLDDLLAVARGCGHELLLLLHAELAQAWAEVVAH